jgi:capsular polysaccharide biosynthesis protein
MIKLNSRKEGIMEKEITKQNQELTLIDIWYLFRNNFLLVLSGTLAIFIFFVIYAWFILTPNYISNADVMIQVEQSTSSSADPNFDLVNAFRLIDTVAELMEKEVVLKNAIDRLESLGYENIDINYLREGLTVNSSSTSYFINISFIDENISLSSDVVDAVIDAVIEETDIEDAFPVLTDKIRRTSFASDAEYYSPNKIMYALIGIILGIIISLGFVIIKEVISTHFRTKEELENLLQTQVLGVIPIMPYKEKKNAKNQK